MNYATTFKKQTIIIVASIITIAVIILGASFAIFSTSHESKDNMTIKAGKLVAEFENASAITGQELVPMSDADALKATNNISNFTVSNTGTLPMKYNLVLLNDTANLGAATIIPHKYIKVSFDNGAATYLDKLKLASGIAADAADANRKYSLVENTVLNSGAKKAHSIRIWIANNDSAGAETPESIINNKVKFKISISGTVNE